MDPASTRTGQHDYSARRRSVPITVLSGTELSATLIRQFAADVDNSIVGSGDTIASTGLLGLVRSGRAFITRPDIARRRRDDERSTVRVDLIDAVRRAVLRRSPPRRLVVVVDQLRANGVEPHGGDDNADVLTCVHTLHADAEVERLTHFDGLVLQVGGARLSTRLHCGLALWSGHEETAVAIADRIVVTDTELLTSSARLQVFRALASLNGVGRIVLPDDAGVQEPGLIDLGAWQRAQKQGRRPETVDGPQFRGPTDSSDTALHTIVLRRCGVLDSAAVEGWLEALENQKSGDLYRIQASLNIAGRRVSFRGFRSTIRRTAAETPWSDQHADDESVAVIVGRRLDRDWISDGFESIETTR